MVLAGFHGSILTLWTPVSAASVNDTIIIRSPNPVCYVVIQGLRSNITLGS